MGERKVLDKYYPPDFDPSKLPRRRQPKNQQIKVRNMVPFRLRCNTCGNYIFEGTKFNTRKENVIEETYLGSIQVFRFYFKCNNCSAEFTIKTNPKDNDYIVESGATRNSEPREGEKADRGKRKRDEEKMGDVMKSLENSMADSKREMDVLAALDEMKSLKSRQAAVSVDEMLVDLQRHNTEKSKEEDKLKKEDEALIQSIFHGSRDGLRSIDDDEDFYKRQKVSGEKGCSIDYLKKDIAFKVPKAKDSSAEASKNPKLTFKVVRKRPTTKCNSQPKEEKQNVEHKADDYDAPLKSLLQNYDSGDESD